MKKRLGIFLLAATLSLGVAGVAFAQEGGGQEFHADLAELNESGASGTADLVLDGNRLTASIESAGLLPNQPHAQHIHGMAQAISECPTLAADKDGDGIISVTEGLPSYGPIPVSFTTTGDTGMESATAADRMPVADANGAVSYSRTLTIPRDVAKNLDNFAIVQHGIDLDGSGKYDGKPSDLDTKLPFEATTPVDCGKIVPTGSATVTMPETGGPSLLLPAAGALIVGLGVAGVALRRRAF